MQQINVNPSDTCKITSSTFLKHVFSIRVSLCALISINTKLVSSEDAFSIKFTIMGIYVWIGWGLVLISGLYSFTVSFCNAVRLECGTARKLEPRNGDACLMKILSLLGCYAMFCL